MIDAVVAAMVDLLTEERVRVLLCSGGVFPCVLEP